MSFESFDQLLSPIFIVDKDCEILYYNHICSTFFQAPPRVLKKFTHLDELIKQDQFSFKEEVKRASKEKSSVVSPEIEFQKQNEEKVTVIAKVIPYQENQFLINILDFSIEKKLHEKYKEQIQELRETHDQILKADKLTALGEMVSGISHEISSPLMIVSNRLDMLQDTIAANQPQASETILKDLEREFKRVLGIISGMKSFVKNQEESLEVVNLDELISDVLSFFEDLNNSVEIKVEKNGQTDSPLIMGNKIKLQQVLINLIKNAKDSIQEKKESSGKIVIFLEEDKDTKTQSLSIIDNGVGIDKNNQDKIFDMFFTTKEMDAGTGLGLAISKKIIEAHSGAIEQVDTEIGARFDLKFPTLELGSFTLTNKYLHGEKDLEDDIFLFVSRDEAKLHTIYEELKDRNCVLVLSQRLEDFEDYTDFMMVDQTVFLDPPNKSLDDDQHDLSQMKLNEIGKFLGVEN